ncbi:hypothetical protein NBT05_01305 [Aquimarina sp. ERC-38]|uniref:hypothetical protein n=1 Tax=Aquimarina sp. ERC-38 TaxID=2949996 RepID=UPI0022472D65|nr:hypothetical protein [Aquimarina sp. ERC-38]UZO81129.1 hypothetical protein NBT05_01305 [Aquimarina sp. ERC-38]
MENRDYNQDQSQNLQGSENQQYAADNPQYRSEYQNVSAQEQLGGNSNTGTQEYGQEISSENRQGVSTSSYNNENNVPQEDSFSSYDNEIEEEE